MERIYETAARIHPLKTAEFIFAKAVEEHTEQTRQATARRLVVWLGNFLRLVQRSVLVQARARLEAVSVESIETRATATA